MNLWDSMLNSFKYQSFQWENIALYDRLVRYLHEADTIVFVLALSDEPNSSFYHHYLQSQIICNQGPAGTGDALKDSVCLSVCPSGKSCAACCALAMRAAVSNFFETNGISFVEISEIFVTQGDFCCHGQVLIEFMLQYMYIEGVQYVLIYYQSLLTKMWDLHHGLIEIVTIFYMQVFLCDCSKVSVFSEVREIRWHKCDKLNYLV